ncbi:MAG: hypothetical protein Kow00107_09870 [Planctomycetota bacterium]
MRHPRLLLIVLSLILFSAFVPSPALKAEDQPGKYKNVIFFLGDGMQLAHEISASRYLFGTDYGLSFQNLPYKTYCTTWDVNTYNIHAAAEGKPPYTENGFDPRIGYDISKGGDKPYPLHEPDREYMLRYFCGVPVATDSASAATAFSSGTKTYSGTISMYNGRRTTTIAQLLRDQLGYPIGVCSTVPFTHASPAAFVSHNIYRGNYWFIAKEILYRTKPDYVVGAGHPIFNKKGLEFISQEDFLWLKSNQQEYYVAMRNTGSKPDLVASAIKAAIL